MPLKSNKFTVVTLNGFLIAAMLFFMAVFALGWRLYPWALGFFLLGLALLTATRSLDEKYSRVLQLDSPVVSVNAGQEECYAAFYTHHWEIPAVGIFRGLHCWGLFPKFERWLPEFACPSPFPEVKRQGLIKRYIVTFRGIPSELGHFGHLGIACRRVKITSIENFFEVPGDNCL